LQRQARLAKTIGKRCDGLVCDVRQQATDRGFGMLLGGLTLEAADKGLHEGVAPWHDRLEPCRSNLTCVQQWAFAPGVSRCHGLLLL
jgi:hypothetical protein